MSERGNTRFSWMDLWVILGLLLMGWAIVWLTKAEPEISSGRQELQELREAFNECQKLVKEGAANSGRVHEDSEWRLQEALMLENEYLNIAERVQAEVPELEKALDQSGSAKVLAERQRRMQELKGWIQMQKERIGFERLDPKSKELKERLASAAVSRTNGPVLISQDLGSLITNVDQTFQRYLSDLKVVTDNSRMPLVGALVATRLDDAKKGVARLFELAQSAQQDGRAIELLLEGEVGSVATQRNRRQQRLQQAFLESGSPADFARRMGPTKSGNAQGSADLARTPVLREVRYILLGALAALGAFLVVDLYRRTVVSPLRLELVEREGMIRHQRKLAHFEELAAGLAHEIRNPLTTISARLYTVQRKLREGTPEHQDAVVIGSEIDRINQILKEFIQITRPSSPKMELMTAAPLLEDISHLMAPQLQRQAVKLEVHPPARAQFYGDQQQLKQVLVNLVQNAAESMEREGEVILRAREEKMPFKGAVKRVAIIEVEDNGPGIRPEVQGRLFEPFFSTKKEGTGLGLPISARIIDRHGGTLDFETRPDHGTIFRIMLPGYEKQ